MKSLLTTISTGFRHDDKPVITEEYIDDVTFEESVKDTINTGFGSGTLHKECPAPKLVEYLNKSNYLSEFKTNIDKELARQNLEVYSSTQVNKLLEQITNNVGSIYVTKKEVIQIIDDLDFVDSTLKSYANYKIPSNLFRL